MSYANRSNPNPPLFLFLFLALVLCLFLFPSSSARTFATASESSGISRDVHTLRVPDVAVLERENAIVGPWDIRRHLEEEEQINTTMILVAEQTRRRDPLNNFKIYTNGFNISSKHYWASVGFTAAPFFIIAAVWFAFFGLCLSIICVCYCCCPREPYGYSRTCYCISLLLLMLFTLLAMIGSVFLYTGQGRFHSITTHTLKYVVHQANDTADNLLKVSDYLAVAKRTGVDSIFLPASVQKSIDTIQTKINESGTMLSTRTEENSKDIQRALDNTGLALIILSAVMLALAFLGFLFSVFGMQCLVYFLVILGWILVAGTFILCGVFLLLHNVVGDTCIAMEEWVLHPTAKTALDDIIPCVDNATAQETLVQTKTVSYQLSAVVDTIINNVSNKDVPPQAGALYYNQSGPPVPALCNPFNPDLSDRKCAPGEVELSNATEVWKSSICQVNAAGMCYTTGRLTPIIYNQMVTAVNLSYGLYRYGPFLAELQDCTFVRQTFTDISTKYCPDLGKYTQWIYVGLVMVSAAVMLSLIFWVIYARERRHRVYTKQFMTPSMERREKDPSSY
ncbi:hypothetical protein Tsubulata_043535 [Turnera subulata]|uniref:Uncharacterized protein n=1 Tax=Turnera subulata TaxID=218843 RepID=A0A9Q0FH41_9ROSI|nr:hypothetical protein Tsubulata_043535 [Turnera subulata]